MAEVEIISATWCKRCHIIKPEVAELCKLSGVAFTVRDMDEMDEKEQANIKRLPTIRMRMAPDAGWMIYTADTLDAWKAEIARIALASAEATDF